MPRVLVVDDDAVVRLALEALLGAVGWQVTCAGDVATALLALLPDVPPYDAVVLDHDLPDGEGVQVASVLGLLSPATHVVLHTGREVAALPWGVSTWLPKRRGPLAVLDHLQAHARWAEPVAA